MTYYVITDEHIAMHDGIPTHDQLVEAVGGGFVELVQTNPVEGTPRFGIWMNEDAFALERDGKLTRNVVGGVIAMSVGAGMQPYPGPLVFTGLDYDTQGGLVAAEMPFGAVLALPVAFDEISRTIAGEDVAGMPPRLTSAFREAAEYSRSAGPEPTRIYSWGDDGTMTFTEIPFQ